MKKYRNIIVQRKQDSEATPNFAIYRMPNSSEIMLVLVNKKGKRTMTVIEDSYTARMLAKRLNQFIDAGG